MKKRARVVAAHIPIASLFLSSILLNYSHSLMPLAYADSAPSLKVGFIGGLSGPAQIYGIAVKNGIDLALRELPDTPLHFVFEDDQFIPAKTVSAYRKLMDVDKVDLVVSIGSTPSNAIAPLTQRDGVPLIAWASDSHVSKGRPNVIRTYPSGEQEGVEAAQLASESPNKKISLLYSVDDYADSWQKGFRAHIPENRIIFSEEIPQDETDLRTIILKSKHAEVDIMAVCLGNNTLSLFGRQLKDLVFKPELLGCETMHDKDEIRSANGGLDGAKFVTVPIEEEFRQKYTDTFGNDSVISGAAIYYDVTKILDQLARRGVKTDFISEILKLGGFKGACGTYKFREDDNDRFFDIPLLARTTNSVTY